MKVMQVSKGIFRRARDGGDRSTRENRIGAGESLGINLDSIHLNQIGQLVHAFAVTAEVKPWGFDPLALVRPPTFFAPRPNECTHGVMSMRQPRNLFRARQHRGQSAARPPTLSFNDALLQVAADDLNASPCVVCGQPGACIGVWVPSTEVVARELGGDPGRDRRLLYRLCGRCGDRCQAGDREFVALSKPRILRSGKQVPFTGSWTGWRRSDSLNKHSTYNTLTGR